MASWSTGDLSALPVKAAPSGGAEIREFPDLARGQIAHATVQPATTADPAILSVITEFFFVLDGSGELWRRQGERDEIVELLPNRCATIPPGVPFQYRSASESLTFLVVSAPRWQLQYWHPSSAQDWPVEPRITAAPQADLPWETCDLRQKIDYPAPDGSEIRLLLSVADGGLAHCTLPAGRTSGAVRHRTLDEIWYVLSGSGQLWREMAGEDEVVDLHAERGVTIPTGTAFQFRASDRGPLEILIGTFPQWPGEDETQPVWCASLLERGRSTPPLA